jgi:tetraacyldisaccharide 4'-kinase
LLLTRVAPTVVARDRKAGAALACEKGAQVIVMDDGHQNFALAKSLSLVVVDAQTGFGNGLMIPAGPLREPVARGLARADAVILVGEGTPDLAGFQGPILRARLVAESAAFSGQRVFAFAGIGRPEKFIESLEQGGATVTGSCFFDDHHPYDETEIDQLRMIAGEAMLVTTEKDFVRLTPAQREGLKVLKVAAMFDEPAALARLLDSLPPAV